MLREYHHHQSNVMLESIANGCAERVSKYTLRLTLTRAVSDGADGE